jgi:exonuclease VII small subunit
MRHLLRFQRSSLIYCALGLAAIIGWSSFAYSTWSARQLSRQVSILTTERDEAIADRNAVRAKHEQLQRSAGELKQVEAKLNMGNVELNRTVRAWAAAEQKLATLNKRVEEAKEGVSQTGSIRQTAPPKRPAR